MAKILTPVALRALEWVWSGTGKMPKLDIILKLRDEKLIQRKATQKGVLEWELTEKGITAMCAPRKTARRKLKEH